MAYQRVMGWVVLLVVLLAVSGTASTVVMQAEHHAVDEQTLYEWAGRKIKGIFYLASSNAPELFENGEKRAETTSQFFKEYIEYAKDSFTRATPGKKEPDSEAFDLLEKSKKMTFDEYQAAKKGPTESVEAANKQYDNVKAKLNQVTEQVCQSCNDCPGAMICCRAPDQQGSGECANLDNCSYGEGYCPPPQVNGVRPAMIVMEQRSVVEAKVHDLAPRSGCDNEGFVFRREKFYLHIFKLMRLEK